METNEVAEAFHSSPEVIETNILAEINHLVEIARLPEIYADLDVVGAEVNLKMIYELPAFKFLRVVPKFNNEYDAYRWIEGRDGQPHKSWSRKTVSADEPMLVKAIHFDASTGTSNPEPVVLKDLGLSFAYDYRLGLTASEFAELFDKEIIDKREL